QHGPGRTTPVRAQLPRGHRTGQGRAVRPRRSRHGQRLRRTPRLRPLPQPSAVRTRPRRRQRHRRPQRDHDRRQPPDPADAPVSGTTSINGVTLRASTYRDRDRGLDLRWWAAANYLTVAQIYLMSNPLLREPLTAADIKPRLLGHWGTSPGLSMIYTLLNRL